MRKHTGGSPPDTGPFFPVPVICEFFFSLPEGRLSVSDKYDFTKGTLHSRGEKLVHLGHGIAQGNPDTFVETCTQQGVMALPPVADIARCIHKPPVQHFDIRGDVEIKAR